MKTASFQKKKGSAATSVGVRVEKSKNVARGVVVDEVAVQRSPSASVQRESEGEGTRHFCEGTAGDVERTHSYPSHGTSRKKARPQCMKRYKVPKSQLYITDFFTDFIETDLEKNRRVSRMTKFHQALRKRRFQELMDELF